MIKTTYKPIETSGFKASAIKGAWIGLIGGTILGVRDCVTVIFNYAPRPFPLFEMLSFSLTPIFLYALIGCVGMAIGGITITMLVRLGEYTIDENRLSALYVGVFTMLSISAIGTDIVGLGTIAEIPSTGLEISLASILCGVALGGLTLYILDKTKKDTLIALGISLFISLTQFLYCGLWLYKNLPTGYSKLLILLSAIGLLLLTLLLIIGIYLLALSFLSRKGSEARMGRRMAFGLLSAVASIYLIISLVVFFRGENTNQSKVKDELLNSDRNLLSGLKDKPNILWIVMDTTRADHLSSYGYHRKTTPNIDRIAGEGLLFENAFSSAPWTLPSHASLLTGMFPSKHGTDAEHLSLSKDFRTIAEVLRLYGYKTYGYSNNEYVGPKTNLNKGFDIFTVVNHYKPTLGNLSDFLLINVAMKHIPIIKFTRDAGAQRTNDVVKQWIADSSGTKNPFFIFINYMEVHDPYGDTPYARQYLDKRVFTPNVKAFTNNFYPSLYGYFSGKIKMSDEDFEILRSLYDVNHLRESGVLDNTLLIITADHGENFGEHKLMDHIFDIYDTVLHVPLIIRYPKIFPSALRIKEQVQLIDIFPTILDVAGIDRSEAGGIQGHSLVPEGRKIYRPNNNYVIAEHEPWHIMLSPVGLSNYEFDVSVYARRLKAIRTNEFKYIWASDGRDELYNIYQDPHEVTNLIEKNPQKAKELQSLLEGWLGSFEHYRSKTNPRYNRILNRAIP